MTNALKSNKGFSVVELLVIVVVLAVIGGGLYVWNSQMKDDPCGQDKNCQTNNQTVEPTLYPTTEPLPTDSNDATINSVAGEMNSLMGEINQLDTLDEDLSDPQVDLSLDY